MIDREDADREAEFADTAAQAGDDARVGLLDALVVLVKHKWLVIGLPLVAGLLGVAYALMLAPTYTATTRILPPQQSQSAGSLLAQFGNLGGLANVKNPSDLYIGMLKSRTVADRIIERFKLMEVYGSRYPSQARARLAQVTNINSGKDTIITIDVDDQDPKRAAELANAYVEELLKLTQVLAVTEASQRRLFFERQLAQAKDSLTNAEANARRALQQGGLVKVDEQGRAIVETTARLRAQIAVKEVQIGAMRTFAAPDHPGLRMAQQELEALRREAAKLEGTAGGAATETERDGKGLGNLALLRNLKYHETMYELLAKQYEVARLDEAKDSAVVQVLDPAVEPDFRSKPKRTLIVFSITLAALFVAVVVAFVREALTHARNDPRFASRLQVIGHYIWRRRYDRSR